MNTTDEEIRKRVLARADEIRALMKKHDDAKPGSPERAKVIRSMAWIYLQAKREAESVTKSDPEI